MKLNKYLIAGFLLFLILIISYLIPIFFGKNVLGDYMFYLSIPVFFITLIYNGKAFRPLSLKLILVFLCTFVIAKFLRNSFSLVYFFIDYIGFYLVLSLPEFLRSDKIRILAPYFLVISVCSILLYLSLIPFISFWDEGRYAGFIHNVNMSVYTISFSLIYIWLYFVNKNLSKTANALLFFLMISLLLYFMYLSDSRSYGIAILFFAAVFLRNMIKNTSWIVWILVVIAIYMLAYIFIFDDNIIDSRIFSNDASMQTRLNLQAILYQQVLTSFSLPNGPNYTTLLIKSYTGNSQMHAHNDFLSLYLNYGIFFIVGMYYFFRKLQAHVCLGNAEMIFLLILFFSTAFHGYLFTFIYLIPFIMIASLVKERQDMENAQQEESS